MTPAGGNLSCQATPGTKSPLMWSAASDARACGYCMEIPRSHASSNKAATANRLFASSPIIDLSAGCQETGTVAVADGAVNGSHALAHNVACLLGMPFYSTPGTRMCSHNLEVGTSNADARLMADEIAQLLLQTIPASVNALDVDVCM
ncbi:hypothetical protein EON66_10825 [archaeon]|nr:MAG: hypothetical protein EON66_10825 [archaeon]